MIGSSAGRLSNPAHSLLGSRESQRPSQGSSVADRLIRRLRVSDPPDRFQRLATDELRSALQVEAVAWVPAAKREPTVVSGRVDTLESDGYRALAEEAPAGIQISDIEIDSAETGVRQVAVAGVANESSTGVGWLIAVNPLNGRSFGLETELLATVAGLIATQRANAQLYADLKELLFGVIRALTSAIDAKDPYTSGHSERVARIAVRLGEELGLAANQRSDLYLMGLLHDVGKIGIHDGVLKKPGKLSPEEYRQIQAHVRIGVHILSDLKKLHHLLPGVAHHHECVDGSGYPAGLSGEEIPMCARILAVADAFDAMSSSRPYRKRVSPDQIDDNFRKGAGSQWDPAVVQALFSCRSDLERIRQKGLGESLRQAVGGALGRS